MTIKRPIIFLILNMLISPFNLAGPVGVSGGYTVADMNDSGDYLLLGDRKVNIKVHGNIFGKSLPGKTSFRYSGNIAT